jgi:periplasmic protein TonB
MKTIINFRTIYMVLLVSVLLFIWVSETKGNLVIPGDEEYFIAVEKIAAPVGGFDGIMKKVVYPAVAQRTNVQGKVYLLIYISEGGDVDDVKVVKGIGAGCDEAATDAIKKTKFIPASDKGVNVKSKLSLPITFKL